MLDEFELELLDEFEEPLLLELFDELEELFELELFDELEELLLLELFEEFDEELELELSAEMGAADVDAGAGTTAGWAVAAGSAVANTTVHHTLPFAEAIPTPINGYCGLSRLARWTGELSHAVTTSAGDE